MSLIKINIPNSSYNDWKNVYLEQDQLGYIEDLGKNLTYLSNQRPWHHFDDLWLIIYDMLSNDIFMGKFLSFNEGFDNGYSDNLIKSFADYFNISIYFESMKENCTYEKTETIEKFIEEYVILKDYGDKDDLIGDLIREYDQIGLPLLLYQFYLADNTLFDHIKRIKEPFITLTIHPCKELDQTRYENAGE